MFPFSTFFSADSSIFLLAGVNNKYSVSSISPSTVIEMFLFFGIKFLRH